MTAASGTGLITDAVPAAVRGRHHAAVFPGRSSLMASLITPAHRDLYKR